jgi:3-hydroxyisobutyrate dehydrogenase-like beta-hydroxyacid dehydrogenase
MGPVGNGQLTKMVNQIAIAGLVQGLSEAVNFADKADLDVKQVLDVISKGAAQSWQMENRGVTMCEDKFEFGFAVDWMRKDLGLFWLSPIVMVRSYRLPHWSINFMPQSRRVVVAAGIPRV